MQYVGCFSHENSFGNRVYGGDGGSLGGGVAAAKQQSLPYVAIANNPSNGHRFAFQSLLARANLDDSACSKGCDDIAEYSVCGCADNYNSNSCHRAWAVYQVAGTSTASVCASEGGRCSCPGEVYYGRKYVEGKPGSGWTTSFDQLKASQYSHIQHLPAVRRRRRQGPIECTNGGMGKFGGDPLPGYYKWCYCDPSR
jgi:hypothetical protein